MAPSLNLVFILHPNEFLVLKASDVVRQGIHNCTQAASRYFIPLKYRTYSFSIELLYEVPLVAFLIFASEKVSKLNAAIPYVAGV